MDAGETTEHEDPTDGWATANNEAPPDSPGRASRAQARRARQKALDSAQRATTALTVVFAVWIAVHVADLFIAMPYFFAKYSVVDSLPELGAIAVRRLYVWYVHAIVMVAAVATFLVWLYRAYVVAREHLDAVLPFSPAGAVAWCFVPFANLWQPYRAISELYRNSDPSDLPVPEVVVENPDAGYREPARRVSTEQVRLPRVPLGVWWTFWVCGYVTSKFAHEQGIVIIAVSLQLCAGVFAVIVTRGIHACQRERARRMDALPVA